MASEADSDNSEMNGPDQPDAYRGGGSVRPDRRWRRCPQCGSTRISECGKPFFANAGLCLIFFVLTMCSCGQSHHVITSIVLGVLVTCLYALPVTACMALVGKHRCQSCGHRFVSAGGGDENVATLNFPWGWAALSYIMLVLLCVVAPLAMRARTAGTGRNIGLAEPAAIITCGLFLWVLVIYHAMVFHGLRKHLKSRLVWVLLLVWPALVIGGRSVYLALPAVRARALLAKIGTATLPASAREIGIVTHWFPDESDIYIRFAANANDIARFLSDSPVLQDVEPERVPAQMLLAAPDGRSPPEVYWAYRAQQEGPEWYRQRLTVSRRCYRVRLEDPEVRIEVTVDDEHDMLYVHLK